MNKIEISNRWTGLKLFEYEKENNTLKETVEKAVKEGADLIGANLEDAYLRGANLGGANLEGADLRGAYIYVDDEQIDEKKVIKDFEEKNNIRLTETHINRNIIPSCWNCFWNYGLIICDWEAKNKKEKMTLVQVCKELGRDIEIIEENREEKENDRRNFKIN